MLHRRRIGLTAAIAVIPLIAVAVVTSCGDDGALPPPVPDSGAQQGQLGAGVCPPADAAPEAGEVCLVPEGTTCSFNECASAIAQCSRGRWKYGGNPAPAPTCPSEIPAADFPCAACFPAALSCLYGTCDGPDATANKSSASCDAGRWAITTVEACSRPDAGPANADGGPKDAGADVQRDADADVD